MDCENIHIYNERNSSYVTASCCVLRTILSVWNEGYGNIGGIESIPKGQYEAAEVLGYSKVQTFWKIIFPQMVKRVLPPVTNEVITLVKDTSLAFALAYTEMFTLAKQVAASTASIMPLFIAGLFYYIFNFLVAMVMEKLEKRMQYFN